SKTTTLRRGVLPLIAFLAVSVCSSSARGPAPLRSAPGGAVLAARASPQPEDAGEERHAGAHAEQGDDALGHPLLPEGDGAAEQEEPHEDQQGGQPVHSAPLVEGMPVCRGSISAAYRSALASALNWHSTMWCAL